MTTPRSSRSSTSRSPFRRATAAKAPLDSVAALGVGVTAGVVRSERHTTAYLQCGPEHGAPLIFLHGWPELSIAWRRQLEHFGALGYRCIAPDMRGYGGSSVPPRREQYALEEMVADMLDFARALGCERAIWIGHDWGSPVVWSLAGHHPEACRAVASLCVPYLASGFTPQTLVPLVDRRIYDEATYPAGQWDYQLYYETAFEAATAAFEADLSATFRALIRCGAPEHRGRPARTARVSREGGWFGGAGRAPDVARDPILSEDDLRHYVAAFTATGFAGANAWYVNAERNGRYAASVPAGAELKLPVLFLHAAYDVVCETLDSRLAEPMRRDCTDLTERVLETGHWMMHEQSERVNETLEAWLSERSELAPNAP